MDRRQEPSVDGAHAASDMPFHYALADAFTICDAYHCSMLGPTDPNRYYMWTGWVGNDGQGGGPVIDNAEVGYDWSTYPERLRAAGVSWKIYQDVGAGLDAADYWGWGDDPYIGNYGDNSLLYFHQYQNAAPGSPLYESARTGTNILHGGTLVRHSSARMWSQQRCRRSRGSSRPRPTPSTAIGRPTSAPGTSAQMLEALTDNPEVWSKTALLSDVRRERRLLRSHGAADPTAIGRRASRTSTRSNEYLRGQWDTKHQSGSGPYGLGARVPMLVVSPGARAAGSARRCSTTRR